MVSPITPRVCVFYVARTMSLNLLGLERQHRRLMRPRREITTLGPQRMKRSERTNKKKRGSALGMTE